MKKSLVPKVESCTSIGFKLCLVLKIYSFRQWTSNKADKSTDVRAKQLDGRGAMNMLNM